MKRIVRDFIRKGMVSLGIGPIVLALVYLIVQKSTGIEALSVNKVCIGIVSLSALAFIAGGMNVIYQIERLKLMIAILIHGSVLYICYLITYLVNGWLESGFVSILVFSGIFVVGYLVIWAIIYSVIKRKTKDLNEMLRKKQQGYKEKQIEN